MPSDTFLNLPKEKQNKILDSAILEFSHNDYEVVSINKIIYNANIPRGSFYMYFKDKEDLYTYILNSYRKRLDDLVFSLLEEENGDFLLISEKIYDKIIFFCENDEDRFLFEKFFKNLRFSEENKFLAKPTKLEFTSFKSKVLELIDKKMYKYSSDDELFDSFMFVIFVTISGVIDYITNREIFNKQNYLNRLNIIKYGIYRKEEKNENIN